LWKGGGVRVYLDNCCYNRPFDDQNQLKIYLETMAKLRVQALMRDGTIEYVWSKVLDYELGQSPYIDQINEIFPWSEWASEYIDMDYSIMQRGADIMQHKVKRMDALHLASALAGGCNRFLTTDMGILRRVDVLDGMLILNPVDFVMEEAL